MDCEVLRGSGQTVECEVLTDSLKNAQCEVLTDSRQTVEESRGHSDTEPTDGRV
jgi:hypothetical protein